jgi:hypothetical protein
MAKELPRHAIEGVKSALDAVMAEFGGAKERGAQTKAEEALGITQSQISSMYNKGDRIGLPTVLTIADWLGWSLDRVLGRGDDGAAHDPRRFRSLEQLLRMRANEYSASAIAFARNLPLGNDLEQSQWLEILADATFTERNILRRDGIASHLKRVVDTNQTKEPVEIDRKPKSRRATKRQS